MSFLEGIFYMMWRGLAIGIIISAPMGPVGILCVQRTLEKGRQTGFFTGVGAALSDLFYCLLTGFGLSFIEDFLKANQNIIQIIGSVVLVFFGIYLFRSNPARKLKKPDAAKTTRSKDVLQGFLFTFSNPLIIFLIIGLFARFNFLLPEITFWMYITGFVFIIIGALLWWWVVSYFVDKVRTHFNLRSMWLINKIIGSVIMVFAVVGIVTAVSGMASAATPTRIYLNTTRGFGQLASVRDSDKPLIINNTTPDTAHYYLPLNGGRDFTLTFRASQRAKLTPWSVALVGTDHRTELCIDISENKYDEIYGSKMFVTARTDGEIKAQDELNEGFEPRGGFNSYKLSVKSDGLALSAGNRKWIPVVNLAAPKFQADSVGIILPPGASITLDNISLEITSHGTGRAGAEMSHFANPDVRSTAFARSRDAYEGEWEIFDRSFDDSHLRVGGTYRLAMVKSDYGYCLVYLSGAQKNADDWEPGATKARLRNTAFSNVYDVEWFDPAGRPLDGEIKAQFDNSPPILTLHFADHNSTLRLRKTDKNSIRND